MSTIPVKDARVPKLRGVLAMIFVSDPARSIGFYKQLGFQVGNTHEVKASWFGLSFRPRTDTRS